MAALTGLASRENRRALRLRLELIALALACLFLLSGAYTALARPGPFVIDGLLYLAAFVLAAARLYGGWAQYLGPAARWSDWFGRTEERQIGRRSSRAVMGRPAATRAATFRSLPVAAGTALPGAPVAAPVPGSADTIVVSRSRPSYRLELNAAALRWLPVAAVVGASLLFRLYHLDAAPGELYGDIAIIYEYVDAVLRGHFPFFFALSTGPLYGYLIAPVAAVLGQQGYLTYKVASVLVSLAGVWLTFLFAREVSGNTRVGLLAAVLLAVSSWYVIFSRLGNAQILIPAVVALSYYLLASGVRRDSNRRLVAGMAASILGLYLMPQTFVLPVAYLASAAFFLPVRKLAVIAAAGAVLLVPFALIVRGQPDLFFSQAGYIGGKAEGVENAPAKILENVIATLLMFHLRGDPTFRSNPPGTPQLDPLSGILMVVGAAALLRRARAIGLPMLLVPVLILLVPANMVLNEPHPTPSASRSIGILPFVALAMAAGVWWARRAVRDLRLRRAVIPGVLGLVLVANWVRYFDDYLGSLPDHNTPYGKIIAETIDDLPSSVSAIVYSCCWGEWGQPEPKGIEYVVRHQRSIQFVPRGAFSCELLRAAGREVYVVWDPREAGATITPITCDPAAAPEVHSGENGRTVFLSYWVGR